jgi:hypothetical protein
MIVDLPDDLENFNDDLDTALREINTCSSKLIVITDERDKLIGRIRNALEILRKEGLWETESSKRH